MKALATLVFAIFITKISYGSTAVPDFFKNLVPTQFNDGLKIERVDVRSCEKKCDADARDLLFIDIEGDAPVQRNVVISISKGIRTMYTYPDSQSFANVKIEQSVAGKYESDKKQIVDNIRNIVKRKKWQLEQYFKKDPKLKTVLATKSAKGKDLITLEEGIIEGYEYIGYTENALGLMEDTLSQIQIFVPQQQITISAYLLNQRKTKFKTIDEFIELRDRFLQNYAMFLPKPAK